MPIAGSCTTFLPSVKSRKPFSPRYHSYEFTPKAKLKRLMAIITIDSPLYIQVVQVSRKRRRWFVDVRRSESTVNHLADSARSSWQMWHVKLGLAVAAISGVLNGIMQRSTVTNSASETTFPPSVLLFRVVPARREALLLFPRSLAAFNCADSSTSISCESSFLFRYSYNKI